MNRKIHDKWLEVIYHFLKTSTISNKDIEPCSISVIYKLTHKVAINGFLTTLIICLLTACNQSAQVEDENLYRIMVGDKYGFINERGQIIIEPQFDYANKFFSEGVCFVKTEEKKGLIDKTGYFVTELPDSIDYVGDFIGGLSQASKKGWNRGIINKKGELIIPLIYDNAEVNLDGDSIYALAWNISENVDWLIVDNNGSIIETKKHESVSGFENGLCRIHINKKWGYLNQYGKLAIDTIFDYAYDFTIDGVACVEKDKKHFFIDKSGKCLFTADSIITPMVCNRATVIINGEKCLVDRTGKKICSVNTDYISKFSIEDKMATIHNDGKAAKIDTMGNIVLSTNYAEIGPFIGGVAPIKSKEKKYGFIDITGNNIINATNNSISGETLNERTKLRAVQNKINKTWCTTYYDLSGNLIWQDIPNLQKKELEYYNAQKEDFINYFDANLANLDPIEGIYYVTKKEFYQNRTNPSNTGMNDTESVFCAITYDNSIDGYRMDFLDNSNKYWVNKFVRISSSNTYAIQKIDKESDYSSDGSVSIDNYSKFNFKLERGHNDWYNFFVTYDLVKDYPPTSEIEKIQQPEWTGTGFAIANGYIATNYHVTSGAKSIRIKGVNGNMEDTYKGFVIASDKEHDLSIIKIVDKDFEGFNTIPYQIGKTTVDVGDEIFVLGYPMTQTMGEEVKLTNGVISSASGYKGDITMYQISAAVQPGNSGGPLFNENGAVIGIVCAKHADAENANYAVKTSYLYSLITSSNLCIDISGNNKVKDKSLSKQVKKIKDFVYLIECSSK